MTTTINASPTNGLVQTADGSGILKVQSNGVTTNAIAWVNFNGSSGAIRSSYNVSSVTRSSTGVYAVNFATATTDANYSPNVGVCAEFGLRFGINACLYTTGSPYAETAPTTSSFVFVTLNGNTAVYDPKYVAVSVFGN